MFLEIVIFFQEGLISVHCNNFGDVRLRYYRTSKDYVFEDAPAGNKSNVWFLVNNTDNIKRREEEQ
jgi:hypothetical protein